MNRTNKWSDDEIMLAMKEVMNELRSQGLNVVYICVYGSQNYRLDQNDLEYQSDLDMKAVVVPTLDDLVLNHKQVTLTRDTRYGQVDVKDIRLFTNNVKKANPAYIECLYTPYYLYSDGSSSHHISYMRTHADELCKAQSAQMARAMFGMMKEKQKAMCHPYPSIKWKIDKWKYDGKQLSHALRLSYMLSGWINGASMADCLVPVGEARELMINYKLNKPTLEEAQEAMNKIIEDSKKTLDDYLVKLENVTLITLNPNNILVKFEEYKSNTIKDSIVEQIKEGEYND